MEQKKTKEKTTMAIQCQY